MKNRTQLRSMRFTLVELLIVISIIALLAALLFPAISSVRAQAKKVKARAAMAALKLAITQYEAQYGLLPITKNLDFDIDDGDHETLKTDKYADLIAILSQVDRTGTNKTLGNPRKRRFLSVTSEYANDGYVDPWGNPFIIGIDSDYDGDVKGFISDDLHGKVFIYSWGEDKAPNGGSKEKDIISWE